MRLIGDSEIHLWLARLDRPVADMASLEALLSPDELARAGRFASLPLRESFVSSRACLRQLIARYARVLPSDVRFAYAEHGKPFLPEFNLSFNVSHSGVLLACALAAGAELGVDIEEMRDIPNLSSVGESVFAMEELAAWRALSEADRTPAFYRCWTRKEALLKATGEGLSREMASFALEWGETTDQECEAQITGLSGGQCWRTYEFQPAPNFAGALAYQGLRRRIVCLEGFARPGRL